jgi:hypothetical protein
MRPSQKNRNARNKSGRKPIGNIVNRVFESAGPEGKVRGTPQQIIDKYLLLARDAQTSGDRVMAENFLQHAEHYIRMLSAAQAQMDERRQQQPGGARLDEDQRDEGEDGDDDDGYAGPYDRQARVEERRPEERRDERRPDDRRAEDRRPDERRPDDRRDERRDDRRREQPAPRATGGLETIDPRGEVEAGPVATPEERAVRAPEPAAPPQPVADSGATEPQAEAPRAEAPKAETAEPETPRPARRPRRRTPKAEEPKAESDPAEASDAAAG